jgi:hypothetical protein
MSKDSKQLFFLVRGDRRGRIQCFILWALCQASFPTFFRAASWHSFFLLASGWAWARERHTITSYLWLSGATAHKHFSRFYGFLGAALYSARLKLWTRVIQRAAAWTPDDQPIEILMDDFTKKKAGDHIDGLDRYRNGAGSARQEYRTLRGLNFVLVDHFVNTYQVILACPNDESP